jgi:CRP-like cAMP-binding protein
MATDTDVWRIAVFAAFEPAALQELMAGAVPRLLRAGETLFRRGEEADGGFLLVEGAILLVTPDASKQEKILRPVTLLGEVAMIAPTTRPVTAIAREPSTVLAISRSLFCGTLEAHPVTAGRVRSLFKNRLAQFSAGLSFPAESA